MRSSSAPEIPNVLLEVVSSDEVFTFTVGAAALRAILKMKFRTELLWISVNLLP